MKRKWLQMHISTAILLMLATCILLWANFPIHDLKLPQRPGEPDPVLYGDYSIGRGWPLPYWLHVQRYGQPVLYGIGPANVVVDVLATLLILLAVARISEWFIRRREARAK